MNLIGACLAAYLVVDLSGGLTANRYPVTRLEAAPRKGWCEADKTERLVLKEVPPGKFMAGEPHSSRYRREFEEPRKAEVEKPFYMGVFEVTQRQWELVTGSTPSVFAGAARPVENVSFAEITRSDGFLVRLREKTGLAFDLPTEDQWEWACRAGTTTPFSAPVELVSDESDPAMDAIGRCWENGGDADGTAEVGAYAANPWGLYDMHGNVWEWTLGIVKGKRCVRGGGHSDYPVCCRSASRLPVNPTVGTSGFGLRVVVNPIAVGTGESKEKRPARESETSDVPWSASFEGEALSVHWARSMDPVPFYSLLEDRGGTYAFVSFDLAEPKIITLKPATPRDLSQTRIRPEGVPAHIVQIGSDEVKVRIDAPCKFSLEPEGCRAPVFVFAEAPERNVPDFSDPKVKVIEPGVQLAGEKGVLVLKDGETLYLERGAVLEGSVIARGKNIRICGRGMIDGSRWEWHRHPYGRLLEADHCQNLTIEDITIRGSGVWTIVPVGCDGVTVRNVKICNGRVQNDDGVDVCNSRNVLIENCFFRTNDDAIALKGLDSSDGDVENVVVRNSTFWIDFARFALLGHESRAARMRGVRFENIDILNFRLPVLLLEPGEDMFLEDVRAEDIRIDNDRPRRSLEIARVRPTVNVYMKTKAPGCVRDVVLNGLSVCGEPFQPCVTIEDYDAEHRTENVVLTNSDARIELVERPVGKRLPAWRTGEAQFHFIHTGVGESVFVIYPDGTSMLIDCGDHEAITRGELAVPVLPNGDRHAGEWVARYVERVNPHTNQVDYLVVSHFHSDHTGVGYWNVGTNACGVPLSGFALAAETLHFKKAVDRGFPDYKTPFAYDKYAVESRDLMLPLYRYLEKRDGLKVERFDLGSSDQFSPLYDPALCGNFSVLNLCANGEVICSDGQRRDLLGVWKRHHAASEPYNENGLSLGLVFSQGPFRLFTAGDFSATAEDEFGQKVPLEDLLAPYVPKCEVAKITHHGYHSMTKKLLEALGAKAIVSPVWDQLHNSDDTLSRIVTHALGCQGHFLPTVFPKKRRESLGEVPSVIPKSCYEGVHVVVSVAPDGRTYRISTVCAKNEDLEVKEQFVWWR